MRAIRITLIFLTVSAISTTVLADGVFVWRNQDLDIREPQQKAFLFHQDGHQDLVLSVKFEGAVEDFGWLVPLPARPEMEMVDAGMFTELSKGLQETYVEGSTRLGSDFESYAIDRPELRVTHHRVGIYDVALMEGGDGVARDDWLNQHGYRLPPGAPEVLGDYARRGWFLAALRIDPARADSSASGRLGSGEIEPVLFRFATDELVFPLFISALGGAPSEVLLYVLAERPLEPAPAPTVTWKVHLAPWAKIGIRVPGTRVLDRSAGGFPPKYLDAPPSYLRTLKDRLPDDGRGLWVTKLMTTLAPEQMRDLFFVPRDMVVALGSSRHRERVEAASYLGRCPNPATATALAALARDRAAQVAAVVEADGDKGHEWNALRAEIIAALWALGRTDRAAAGREAFAVVNRLWEIPEPKSNVRNLRYQCSDLLVETADETLLPDLRQALAEYYDPDRWDERSGNERLEQGQEALVVAAAAGDSDSRDELIRCLRRAARRWPIQEASADTVVAQRLMNGFPRDLGPVARIDGHAWLEDQRLHAAVIQKLALRPAVQADVLRRSAADTSLTPAARTALLATMDSLSNTDVDLLMSFWDAARETRGGRVYDLYRGSHGRRCPQFVCLDATVSAVLRALGKHGRADILLSLVDQVPQDDLDTRGELVSALASTHDGTAVGVVVDYVRRVWNDRIGKLTLAECYDGPQRTGPQTWRYSGAFDPRYRETAIERFLSRHPRAVVDDIIADATLDPRLRLFWLDRTMSGGLQRWPEEYAAYLDDIQPGLVNPDLVAICEGHIRPTLERMRAMRGSR